MNIKNKRNNSSVFETKDFYSITEVEKLTGIKKHTIRYWEKLSLFSSFKLPSGYRKYTSKNIDDIFRIKNLIYDKNYSTKMVKLLFFSKNFKQDKNLINFDVMYFISHIKKEIQKIINIIS